MAEKDITTKLILNTAQRTSGVSHCASFTLKNPGIRMSGYAVQKINIPHSFYNITDNNNQIDWEDDTATSQVSTLTNGNYSIDELLTHIGSVMTTDTLADSGTATYTATKDVNTKKVTITNNLLANFEIHWSTNAITKQLAHDLGFFPTPTLEDRGKPVPIDVTGAATYTGNNSYWIGVPRNINVRSNLAQLAKRPAAVTVLKDGGIFNILEMVLVPTVSGEITSYEPDTLVRVPTSDNMLFEITVELLDENFNALDLNGLDWELSVLIYNYR